MFRKLTEHLNTAADRVTSAAAAVLGTTDPKVESLTSMGFSVEAATNALQATNGNVDRAAELLLAQGSPMEMQQNRGSGGTQAAAAAATGPQHQTYTNDSEDAALQRVLEESRQLEEQRRQRQQQQQQNQIPPNAMQPNPSRTAAVRKAGEAAMMRFNAKNNTTKSKAKSTFAKTTTSTTSATTVATKMKPISPPNSNNLAVHHPDVKVLPTLQEKSKEEQILRCADRLKSSPNAVDTLYRALTTIQSNPDDMKYRKIDKTTAGYQRSLENAPGAEDLLLAMSFKRHGMNNTSLVLERSAVDPALLYLGVSALEQTKLTNEYKEEKAKIMFAKTVNDIRMSANFSESEAIKRSEFMSKIPSEPSQGRGALMQVKIADDTIRRRFDGDDTLLDVLNWLGGHGSIIPTKILNREWSLVDLNHFPITQIDCEKNQHNTLQYIGCWPSGNFEIVPSTYEWKAGGPPTDVRSSCRGLGSAPRDAL